MSRKRVIAYVVVGLLFCVLLGLLWYYAGLATAAASTAAIAGAAAHRRRDSRERAREALANAAERDAAEDATAEDRATEASADASASAGTRWTEQPTRTLERLLLLVACMSPFAPGLVTATAEAQEVSEPACVPYDTYGPHASAAGYGLWVEDNRKFWCPCLRAEQLSDTNRISAGCAAPTPLVGYTLQAHVARSADIAKARSLLASNKATIETLRRNRQEQLLLYHEAQEDADALQAALADKSKDLDRSREQNAALQARAAAWVKTETVAAYVLGALSAVLLYEGYRWAKEAYP